MEHTPPTVAQVIEGDAIIQQKSRSTIKHSYSIVASKPSRILENTLYFPGWNIYVDGIKTPIQFQDPSYRGLMTYILPSGNHTVIVQFEDTKIRRVANILSLISCCILIGILIIFLLWKRKK